ncbi:hypothetical protein Tco_1479770 [Tanacetum coccineum]
MDWYTKNALWLYWKRGDDEEIFTYDEFSDLEEENLKWFDDHEPIEGDDDEIRDLDDYLILQNAPYYVDEEEERFKERKRKLLGIPYEKLPTFKSKKFKSLFALYVDTAYPTPWIRIQYGVSITMDTAYRLSCTVIVFILTYVY